MPGLFLPLFIAALMKTIGGQSASTARLRLFEEERYEVNMQQLLQDYAEVITVAASPWPGDELDAKYNLSDNWHTQFAMSPSNLTTECVDLTGDDSFAHFNNYGLILNRIVKVKNNTVYI